MSPPVEVLVVDDETVVRDAVRLVLSGGDWRVATAGDVESALEHPALSTCGLVICDLMLPGRSGAEAIRALRRIRAEVPIIAITGYATPATRDEAVAAGATAFLAKPFDESELLDLVRRTLSWTGVAGEETHP